jgi:DNA repair protein RadC
MPSKPSANYLTIHDFPSGERPRERLQHYGAAALSNSELLAILLRVGSQGENVIDLSTRLLRDFKGLDGLARAGFNELLKVHNLGPAKVAQLKACQELGRRLMLASPDARPQITSPSDAATC